MCEGSGEDLNEGIKNPTGVDSSVVTDVPIWWEILIMGEAMCMGGPWEISVLFNHFAVNPKLL